MLTVKAVRANGEYSIFQSEHVDVVPSGVAPNCGPGIDVVMFENRDEAPTDVISIDSCDPEVFVTAYIMNERGKTVDTVHAPGPQSDSAMSKQPS